MFTLKIIIDEDKSIIRSDDRHPNGGCDVEQVLAFNHLMNDHNKDIIFGREILFTLAKLHNWNVFYTFFKDGKITDSTGYIEA